MPLPTPVNEDIETGKQYLSDLVTEYLADMDKGSCQCNTGTLYLLNSVLNALIYKQEIGIYDTVAQSLYLRMMLIIGGTPYNPPIISNVIYTGIGIPTTEEEILAGIATAYVTGEDMLAVFDNPDFEDNFIAVPIDAPIPTQYENIENPLDKGDIGSPTDAFGEFTEVGDFLVSTSNYPFPIIGTYKLS